MTWTDKDMLKFARVASGGSYGDYKGCKSLQSKLKKYKLMKDLNKHRQVKSVDSNSITAEEGSIIPPNTSTDIYSIDNEIVAMPNITALVIHLMKKYPNDADLGKHVRATVLSWREK